MLLMAAVRGRPVAPGDLLNVEEVAAKFHVSETTIWELEADGEFPRPVRIGTVVRADGTKRARFVKWPLDDLELFIASGGDMAEYKKRKKEQ